MSDLKTADQYFPNAPGEFLAGFNTRIFGTETLLWPHTSEFSAGYYAAQRMISEGKIYYVQPFKHECRSFPFLYGGKFVCNDCGRSDLEEPFWTVKVYMDGNQYCVVGPGFQNLQESDNVAFGETKEVALENYRKVAA